VDIATLFVEFNGNRLMLLWRRSFIVGESA
jgi:hypothetical protein